MDRRHFLRLFGGGLTATATMAEAGMLAEFLSWLKRKPVWSFPSGSGSARYLDMNAVTMKYIMPALVDNFFRDSPLFLTLKARPLTGGQFYGGKRLLTPVSFSG
jgi:hypothetical protein